MLKYRKGATKDQGTPECVHEVELEDFFNPDDLEEKFDHIDSICTSESMRTSISDPPSDVRSEESSYASDNSERQMRKFKFQTALGATMFKAVCNEVTRNLSIAHRRARLIKILQNPPAKRTEAEICDIIDTLKGLDYFKRQIGKLGHSEWKDLASSLEYTKVAKGTDVINYGEIGDKFYLVLSGFLGVYLPNPKVKEWNWAHSEYNKLLDWQKNEFHPRVRKAMNSNLQDVKKRL